MGELIQFVPKANPKRDGDLSAADRRAIELFEYVASAGYPVPNDEIKGVMKKLADDAPPCDCA